LATAARVFSALGASIHAYTASPRPTPESRKDAGYWVPGTGDPEGTIPTAWYSGTTKESLHTFLSSGLDALLIALPLTPATRHLFGKEEFALLAAPAPDSPEFQTRKKGSKGAFLINIARGPIIDQPALVEALNNETLAGAALDVTDPEPLPKDDPLWDAKNVIITPHVSSLGIEYTDRAYDLWLTNWERHEKGETLFNLVQRKRGY
jgi:phosphoglycerate dehydrogenase-like enzyme